MLQVTAVAVVATCQPCTINLHINSLLTCTTPASQWSSKWQAQLGLLAVWTMLSFSVHISASERSGSPCSLLHLPQPMLSCRASLKPHAMPAGGSAPPCYSCSPVANLALSCEVCPHPHAWLLRARSIRFSLLPEDSQAEHWPATAGPFHPLTSCQLMSRHWVIRDAAGTQTDEVQGRAGAGGAGVWARGARISRRSGRVG
jgi:hypothetical protein